MSDVHTWCKAKLPDIKALVDSFYANEPGRFVRPANHTEDKLVQISGQIESALGTLRSIKKSKSVFKQMKDLVGNERTPDMAFFGPVPNLSFGDAAGFGTALGAAADLGMAVTTIWKGAMSEKKLSNALTVKPPTQAQHAQASAFKYAMRDNYTELVHLLHGFAEIGSEFETAAKKLEGKGLNRHNLAEAWNVVQNYKWVVLVA